MWLLPFSSLNLVSGYPFNDYAIKSGEIIFTSMSPLDISEKDKGFSKSTQRASIPEALERGWMLPLPAS